MRGNERGLQRSVKVKEFAALCCYFGPFPAYFQLWLESCRSNPGIDFLLMTDNECSSFSVPSNVKILNRTFDELRHRVQEVFREVNVCLSRPYKICDFRVAYGYIFSELFAGYRYWGWYDLDTIWGDVLSFIPRSNEWFKIFPCGHLSFVRNNKECNEAFMSFHKSVSSILPWQEVFASSKSCFYDEIGGADEYFAQQYARLYFRDVVFEDIGSSRSRFWNRFASIHHPDRRVLLSLKHLNGKVYSVFWKDGHFWEVEVAYVHMQKRDMCVRTDPNSDKYLITARGFLSYRDCSNLLKGWHGLPWLNWEKFIAGMRKLRRKMSF